MKLTPINSHPIHPLAEFTGWFDAADIGSKVLLQNLPSDYTAASPSRVCAGLTATLFGLGDEEAENSGDYSPVVTRTGVANDYIHVENARPELRTPSSYIVTKLKAR